MLIWILYHIAPLCIVRHHSIVLSLVMCVVQVILLYIPTYYGEIYVTTPMSQVAEYIVNESSHVKHELLGYWFIALCMYVCIVPYYYCVY